jgi:hypothetical protein
MHNLAGKSAAPFPSGNKIVYKEATQDPMQASAIREIRKSVNAFVHMSSASQRRAFKYNKLITLLLQRDR